MFKPVKTPCIGICSTGVGDDVCRGCKRFAHEVVNWNGYTNDQRRLIVQRLEQLLIQLVSRRLLVVDVDKLSAALQHQQIHYNEQLNPYWWVFDLLRAGASQINDLSFYGLQYRPGWENVSLGQIRDDIDSDYFALSEAHYQRYINVHA